MKNIIKISFLTLTAAILSISCLDTSKYEGNDPASADGAEYVTIVDGGYETPYYVIFDNGQTAYVSENKVAQSITFPSSGPMKGEVRKLIYFNYENNKREGYDYSIRIVGMGDIYTSLLKDISDEELSKAIPSHTASLSLAATALSKKCNYITLRIYFLRSEEDHFKHSFILAHNKERLGMFKDAYGTSTDADSYIWLELYHDNDTDYEIVSDEAYASYKIDTEYLGLNDLNQYKGVKILYKDMETNGAIKIHTILF